FALRSCALHYALDEGHVHAIVDAARDAGRRRVQGAPRQAEDELAALIPLGARMAEDATCAP
ncbi:MAG TPA: hypothetical protein VK599_06855, partial [Streptosporangiaceae bacterium]|nr:hypothetical protein [Streptosporangiaceae bacterium]